jgi:TDG/mug DNA glycosylase family protein
MSVPQKPSRRELAAARDKTVHDVVAPGLQLLFVGINPGLYSAAIGRHFGRPGNRFWPTLQAAGFTDRLLTPYEDEELLRYGYGITNLAPRTTATADELTREELVAGARRLEALVATYRPKVVAFLGVGAYRQAFHRPKAQIGPQEEMLAGSKVWVLPNPSGLNAHYQLADLAKVFRELWEDVHAEA